MLVLIWTVVNKQSPFCLVLYMINIQADSSGQEGRKVRKVKRDFIFK